MLGLNSILIIFDCQEIVQGDLKPTNKYIFHVPNMPFMNHPNLHELNEIGYFEIGTF